jgi:hypothetical protein
MDSVFARPSAELAGDAIWPGDQLDNFHLRVNRLGDLLCEQAKSAYPTGVMIEFSSSRLLVGIFHQIQDFWHRKCHIRANR